MDSSSILIVSMNDFNTTTTVAENNNNFSASTPLSDFLYHQLSTFNNFTGNESLIDEPMSEELFSNFSSVNNETTENMLLDDVSLLSSLISSNVDHFTNFSALVEENGDLYNRSEVGSDIATTHSSGKIFNNIKIVLMVKLYLLF